MGRSFLSEHEGYVGEGEAEGLEDGTAAFSREALMAFKSTIEVYLLSSE